MSKFITTASNVTPENKRNNGFSHFSGFILAVKLQDANGSDWIQRFNTANELGEYLLNNPTEKALKINLDETWKVN